MRILIIGYGSIGKRHYAILKDFKIVKNIDVVTKQNIDNIKTFKTLDDIKDISIYDYFIISSETIKHYKQLKYICNKVSNKKILVEKPLYDKKYEDIKTNNKIYTAYNLRFHPIIEKLKEILKNEQIYYANIICGQYLPTWRPKSDYRKSYSADINQGGGVLRDLSHELDYANWLFGEIDTMQSINTKISDLEINSDDIFTAIATTKNKIIINITMDYISKTPIRQMIIHTKENTIQANIIENIITIDSKSGKRKTIKLDKIDRNWTYIKMHQEMLDNNDKILCSFEDGKNIVDIIHNIILK